MSENKFIAISEDEYNSFKHGEYEREIKKLKEEVEKLKKEKKEALLSKGVIVKYTERFGLFDDETILQILSNENFENEILNYIKTTPFKRIVKADISTFKEFDKEDDYVVIGNNYYYKNKWCEELKKQLELLSYQVKRLINKRDELEQDIKILEENDYAKSDKESFLKRIVNKYGKK